MIAFLMSIPDSFYYVIGLDLTVINYTNLSPRAMGLSLPSQ